MNLAKLTNTQLVIAYDKLNHLQMLSHGTAIATTWFVDSDGEDLTNYLLNCTNSFFSLRGCMFLISIVIFSDLILAIDKYLNFH